MPVPPFFVSAPGTRMPLLLPPPPPRLTRSDRGVAAVLSSPFPFSLPLLFAVVSLLFSFASLPGEPLSLFFSPLALLLFHPLLHSLLRRSTHSLPAHHCCRHLPVPAVSARAVLVSFCSPFLCLQLYSCHYLCYLLGCARPHLRSLLSTCSSPPLLLPSLLGSPPLPAFQTSPLLHACLHSSPMCIHRPTPSGRELVLPLLSIFCHYLARAG
mmetsp:Transcript_24091/g.61079  ORF Transcript_24091/g.61079 Transcript_24091/m.61079 type:complete len:212 (-) Transcript_24091:518-1153(-)